MSLSESRVLLRSSYTTIAGEEIARVVSTLHTIGPIRVCRLLRRGFNDVYEIETSDGAGYVARLQADRRSRGSPNTVWETAFLRHARSVGAGVAAPIEGADGSLQHSVMTESGPRVLVIFERLTGERPGDDPAAISLMGEELARIHGAGTSYSGPESRVRLDIDHLLNRPQAMLRAVPTMDAETAARFSVVADELRTRHEKMVDGLTRVVCHGDCHGGNTFVSGDGPGRAARFFDFDDGGPGFLAYDVAVYLWGMLIRGGSAGVGKAHSWKYELFLRGYSKVGALTEADRRAIPLFVSLRHFWFLGEYAGRLPEWGTEALPRRYLLDQVELLDRWRRLRAPRAVSPPAMVPNSGKSPG